MAKTQVIVVGVALTLIATLLLVIGCNRSSGNGGGSSGSVERSSWNPADQSDLQRLDALRSKYQD